MNVVVLGAGAVGGYFGGRLALQGTPVTFLVRERRFNELNNGLQVQSTHGDFSIEPKLALRAEEIEKPDIVIVALKNYHLPSALPQIRTLVNKGALVLPLLNGVQHIDLLVSEFGQAAIVGGACYIEATLGSAGQVIHTSPMHDVIFGSLTTPSPHKARLDELEAAFRASGVPVSQSPAIMVDMWQKFIFLTSFSAITAATRKEIGSILADEVTQSFLADLVREIITVGTTQVSIPEHAFDQVMKRLQSISPTMTSSLHRDLEKGLPLEIDSLQGAVLDMAREHRIEAPCVRGVYALLHPSKNGR